MSPNRPVAEANAYRGQTWACVGTQPVSWGIETLFCGWAHRHGVVWWTPLCESQAVALELAYELFDRHAEPEGDLPYRTGRRVDRDA